MGYIRHYNVVITSLQQDWAYILHYNVVITSLQQDWAYIRHYNVVITSLQQDWAYNISVFSLISFVTEIKLTPLLTNPHVDPLIKYTTRLQKSVTLTTGNIKCL